MPRKGQHGDGVYEDPKDSGIFWARWTDELGKDRCKKIGTGDKGRRDAQKYSYRQREIAREKTLFPERYRDAEPVVRWTLKQAVEDFQEHSPATRESSSWRTDGIHGRAIVKLWGDLTIDEIQTTDVRDWMTKRLRSRAPSTVVREVTYLLRVCTRAIERGMATRNPAAGIKRPKTGLRPPRYLLPTEESGLREHLVGRDWLTVELAYRTGMRASEQFPLKKDQIDWHSRRIILPKPKSRRPEVVILNTRSIEILRELCQDNNTEWIFPGPHGHLRHKTFVTLVFRAACRRAGIVGLRWHDLRHTFASWMAIAGVDLYRIQQLMRHRSIEMTQRYAHLMPDHLSVSVEVMSGPAPMGVGLGVASVPKEQTSRKRRSSKPESVRP